MTNGLTPQGFNKKNFQDIKLDIETTLRDSFGTINLNDESVFGQLVGIFSEREALLWYALESIYNAMYPDTANDFSLDNVCQYIGLTRLAATPTTVTAELTGQNQTFIPVNSEVSALGVNTTFKLLTDTLITNDACLKATINIDDIAQPDYTIIINSVGFTYTLVLNDTKDMIISGLVALINASAITVTASNVSSQLVLISDDTDAFSVFLSNEISFFSLMTTGDFVATTKGEIPLPAGALTTIQTPIGGWISVYNPLAGKTGRNLESDAELRLRRAQSLRLPGAGTVEAIRARLLNLVGVTSATVNENITDMTSVEGLPPHSFEALVLGGDDGDIGNTIWQAKPAGIASYGNTQIIVQDSTGRDQVVFFSRPTNLYIYINIDITLDDTNTYPTNGTDTIKNNIVAQIRMLNVSDDVIYQSLYKSVYSVSGIESAIITIGGTLVELTVPPLVSANIDMPSSQIAVTDLSKVTINII